MIPVPGCVFVKYSFTKTPTDKITNGTEPSGHDLLALVRVSQHGKLINWLSRTWWIDG